MIVSVAEAETQLADLVRRAQEGEEITLSEGDRRAVRLVPLEPVKRRRDPAELRRIMEEIAESGARHALPGPSAARSQDFLYDEDGLPA